MLTQKIRRQFLQYFKDRQHAVISSSPVIPHDDPTLLFINAGMNQFKDVFLGNSSRDYSRATTSQKCIRVGGKHNDLENVGHTSRHLTFFEMLGNFSFGDYFKKDAIRFAWEVSTQIFGFEPERLWPTVFREDDEAFELWTQYVPAERITRFDEKDNFWAMGDTGPCGPCSELLYDKGSHYGNAKKPVEDVSGERFLEFWNLVFMQYNRLPSGTRQPLPRPSIDTGAGIERVVSLKMGVESVFDTDVLRGLIARTEEIAKVTYDSHHENASAFRVIADHLRCLAFAIADGVQPSNVDRGYVLRKVLRRAVRYGRFLGLERPFLADILPQLITSMGEDYPELSKAQSRISEILTREEEAFLRTLRRGGNILNQVIEKSKTSTNRMINGDDAFKLKDTYGLPLEEILLIARDSDLTVDQDRFQVLEEEARQRSKSVHKTVHQIASESIFADFVKEHGESKFIGYTHTASTSSIVGLVVEGEFVVSMDEGQEGMIFLEETPFYAEMGGQVGDIGLINSSYQEFRVQDCVSPYKGLIAHKGILIRGTLRLGDIVNASIDRERRQKIANNHTATHLLHWALQRVLGEHVKQAGSVVDPQRLRFDFSHHKALTLDEIRQIEDLVNEKIRENTPVKWYEIRYEEAQKRDDIKQFFGEKYGSSVRVIDIDYSKELCGGTHTSASGNIGLFKIAKEGSIAAGIRRIEAVTGLEAELLSRQQEDLILKLSTILKAPSQQLQEKAERLLEENKQLTQELKELKKGQINQLVDQLTNSSEKMDSFSFIAAELSLPVEELRLCMERLIEKQKSAIALLATTVEGKCQILVRITDNLVSKGISAQTLVKTIAPIIEGSGGGKANAAQAGGKAPHNIQTAFDKVRHELKETAKQL